MDKYGNVLLQNKGPLPGLSSGFKVNRTRVLTLRNYTNLEDMPTVLSYGIRIKG